MYGKLMSVSDEMMFRYFELVTRVSEDEIQALRQLHPMEAKKKLARTITSMYHGEAGAEAGEAHFSRVVQGRQSPETIERIILATPSTGLSILNVVVDSGFVATNSEGRRLILQGAVELDGKRRSDPNELVPPGDSPHLLRVGKRRFKYVELKPKDPG
jgi:tyrosyl-tRNA synthetase